MAYVWESEDRVCPLLFSPFTVWVLDGSILYSTVFSSGIRIMVSL